MYIIKTKRWVLESSNIKLRGIELVFNNIFNPFVIRELEIMYIMKTKRWVLKNFLVEFSAITQG